MGSYAVLVCDSHISDRCEDDKGNAPDGATLALARRNGKRVGWIMTGRNGCICSVCAKVLTGDTNGSKS